MSFSPVPHWSQYPPSNHILAITVGSITLLLNFTKILTGTVPDIDVHFVPCRHLSASQSVYIHIGISGNDGIQSWGLLEVRASIMHSGIIVIRKSLIVREVSDPKVFLFSDKASNQF